MNEQEFDPRDLNQDGKVSLKEKILDMADKANEKLSDVAEEIKGEAIEAYEEVKKEGEKLFKKKED